MASDEQIARIVKAYEAGKSVTRIVRELGIPKHWVTYALGTRGIRLRMGSGERGTNVTLLRPMRNTSTRMTTVPAGIIKELGIDRKELWEVRWSILDKDQRLLQAEIRPRRGMSG